MEKKDYIPFASTISNPTIHLKIRKERDENPRFSIYSTDEVLLEKADIGESFTKSIRRAQLTILRRRIVRMINMKAQGSIDNRNRTE